MSTVLVVNDEIPLLRTLGENLRKRSYGAQLTTTGRQAVAMTERRPADAIILDLGPPRHQRHEVLDRIRGWTTVPVIVLGPCRTDPEGRRA